jgi:subtilisin family serine protease
MLRTLLSAFALLIFSLFAASAATAAEGSERFLVGFESRPGDAERDLVRAEGARIRYSFPEVRALAVAGPPERVRGLEREGRVRYVEKDAQRHALGLSDAELQPSRSNGLYGLLTTKATDAHGAGVTGTGAKVCVADTGIDADHADVAPNYQGGIDTVSDDGDPDVGNSADETHGTHVAGTAAGALTTQGVRGVAYDADLFHARVMDAEGGYVSDIMAGVRHLVEQRGCKVINLSLGGGSSSTTEQNFYQEMYDKGALTVAAAGNGGGSSLSYPAGYSVVLSVGAVDANNAHASFSNTGQGLDLSAPGVAVLSSVPDGRGSEASVETDSNFRAFGLEHAGNTTGITKTLVDAGTGNTLSEFPTAVNGNIALMQRGGESFATKVQNAMKAGAVAAVIYNNSAGDFAGTLGSATAADGSPWIPAVSVSDTTGATLKSQSGSSATLVNKVSSWDHFDGTSMATPHVAGVAALVFSANGTETNREVEARLKNTATDLGTAGYDTTFGYGLVNADAWAAAPPPVTAFPSGTIVQTGSVRSGTATRLRADDNSYYQVNSTKSGTRTSAWYGSFTGVPNGLRNLSLTYKGKNSRTCAQTLSVWNWTTDSWVQLDSRSVGTSEVRIDKKPTEADYVSGGSGDGELRLRVRCTRSSGSFYSSGDLMSIVYERSG